MNDEIKEPKVVKEPKAVKEAEAIDFGNLTTFEILQLVAGLIENEKGTHSPKHYRMLADDVRALAAKL